MRKNLLYRLSSDFKRLITLFTLLFIFLFAKSQTYTIGTGTANITASGVTPFSTLYEDNRIQYLYLASELTAAGATAGNISALAFNFSSLGSPTPSNVNIRLGNLPAATTSIDAFASPTGVVNVYTATSVSPTTGWYTFNFSTFFAWNGTSNIVVEVCRDNNSFSANYQVVGTNFAAASRKVFGYFNDGVSGCSITSGSTASNAERRDRPNCRFTFAVACSGSPTGGTASATPISGVPGSNFTANVTGATSATGLTYQWQSSPNGSAPWTNVTGATTLSSVITSVSSITTTYYRLAVTCTSSGLTGYSSSATYTTTYCAPTGNLDCTFSDYISNISFNTLNNTTTCGSGGYTLFTASGSQTTSLMQSLSYNFSLSVGPGTVNHGAAVWIDFNRNGIFTDANEYFLISNSIVENSTTNISIPIPAGASLGTTRMRVRYGYNQTITSGNSCSSPGTYGETEDYTVTIVAAVNCTTPLSQPTSLVLSSITTSSIGVAYTGSSASGYLVIQTTSATPPTAPQNGISYPAGSVALGGTIVNSGFTTNFTAGALIPGTQYWYWVYAYNDACVGQPVYNVVSPLNGSATTLTCGAATANSFTYSSGSLTSTWSGVPWTAGIPSACQDVTITYNQGGGTNRLLYITLDRDVTIRSLSVIGTFSGGGQKILAIETNGYNFTVLNDFSLNAGSGGTVYNYIYFTGTNNGAKRSIISIGGNSTIGGIGDLNETWFGGVTGANPTFIFRGNATYNYSAYSNPTGTFIFDKPTAQTLTNEALVYVVSFGNVVVGLDNPTQLTVNGSEALYTGVTGGNLTINNNSSLTLPDQSGFGQINDPAVPQGTLTLNGNAQLLLGGTASGPITFGAGTFPGVAGSNFPANFASYAFNPTSTVNYNSGNTINQTVYAPVTYGNLTLSNTTGSGSSLKSLTASITGIAGNLTVDPYATFSLGTYTANRNSPGGSFVTNANANLLVGGTTGGAGANNNFPNNFSTYNFNTTSTTTYNSSLAQGLFGGVDYGNLIIDGSLTKTAPALLTVKGNFTKSNNSVFAHNNGRVLFNGNAGQVFSNTSGFPILFNRITNSSTGTGLTINSDSLTIADSLSLTSGSQLKLGTGDIILKSTAAATARIGVVPAEAGIISYPGAGRFIVERSVSAYRAWRFLSTPVAKGAGISPTVQQSWQELGNPASNGYGTFISGPEGAANGFDAVSPSYSMKWFDGPTNNYINIRRTTDSLIANDQGYMVFVRADRVAGVSGTITPANLRIKGQLRTGDQVFNLPSGNFHSIGNPYASAVDMDAVFTDPANAGIAQTYIAWDPSLSGSYFVGGYQYVSKLGPDPYEASAPGTALYGVGELHQNIQSGQAIFVTKTAAGATSVTFKESMKASGSDLVSRDDSPADRQFMSSRLYSDNGQVADGNFVAFDDEFSNTEDGDDVLKFSNGGENWGMLRFGKRLAIEARKRLQETDTIFYNMSNLKEQVYQLKLMPKNLATSGMEGYFIDRFLNTQTAITLSDTTLLSLAITSNPASKAADRFYLVFKPMAGPVPVTFVSVAAQRQADRSIKVDWKVANEVNIVKYEVERSANGTQFSAILTRDAESLSTYTKNDLSPLAADNFYRIKAIGIGGELTYSPIVKVAAEKSMPVIAVTPNPVKDKQLNIRFMQQAAGNYMVQLSNALGQVVYKGSVSIIGSSEVKQIALPAIITAGTYQVSVRDGRGALVFGETVVVE